MSIKIQIDETELGSTITSIAGKKHKTRSEFVKAILEAFKRSPYAQVLNILVFNTNHSYIENLSGVKFYATVPFGDVIYAVWVFERGTFKNKGNLGFDNWAMHGWFKKEDDFVTFKLPTDD